MRLGVVYLARAANPPRYLRFFLESLRRHPAGAEYDLIVLAKGFAAPPPGLAGVAAPGLARVIVEPADDATFATNLFAAMPGRTDHDAYLFHVSWSRVLAPGWARLMLGGLERPGVGAVGASGGWERLAPGDPFPNVSLRTTGFLIGREVWASLDFGDLSTKYGGNLFEAGPRSMTKQLLRRGLTPLVAGRDGTLWEPARWAEARTFRSGDQERLLFADNRTTDYAAGSLGRRRKLAALNWGDPVWAEPASARARLRRRIAWRFGGDL